MKRKINEFNEIDFSLMEDNFYNINKDFFLNNKPLHKRLSEGYINFDKVKNELEFYEKATRYITRTAYSLFSFITKEEYPSVRLDIRSNEAFCSLEENKIVVGIKMLTFKKIPSKIKVDTIISTVFHEMYHKRYTIKSIKEVLGLKKHNDYYKVPAVKTYLKDLLVDETMKSIINILEDKRIEANGAEDFPGYSFYFEEARKYAYFLHSGKKIMPPYDGLILDYLMMDVLLPELKISFLEVFNSGIKILEEFKNIGQMSNEEFLKHKTNHEEVGEIFKKFQKYFDKNRDKIYSSYYDDIITSSKEIYDLIPKENRDSINDLISKNDIKGYIKIIQTAGGKSFLTEEGEELPESLINEIESIISDELEKLEKETKDSLKNKEKKVTIEKIKSVDKNSEFTEFEIIEEQGAIIDTLLYSEAKQISKNICNNLGFLDSKFSRNIETFELTEGELDEDELFSIAIGNKYLFQDVEELPQYSLDFGILLDESGSMSNKIREAKLATLSMILGLKDNKHINLFVYGHTANSGNNRKAIQIYKYYNTIQKFTDFKRIFNASSRSNNADGYAIEKISEIMKESKSRDKIMIVVSDGQPSAYGYGGASGEAHVKSVVDRLESEGITVIQVCMDYIENSPRMFKHYVPYAKSGSFFDNLKKILITKLNQFAESI